MIPFRSSPSWLRAPCGPCVLNSFSVYELLLASTRIVDDACPDGLPTSTHLTLSCQSHTHILATLFSSLRCLHSAACPTKPNSTQDASFPPSSTALLQSSVARGKRTEITQSKQSSPDRRHMGLSTPAAKSSHDIFDIADLRTAPIMCPLPINAHHQ